MGSENLLQGLQQIANNVVEAGRLLFSSKLDGWVKMTDIKKGVSVWRK